MSEASSSNAVREVSSPTAGSFIVAEVNWVEGLEERRNSSKCSLVSAGVGGGVFSSVSKIENASVFQIKVLFFGSCEGRGGGGFGIGGSGVW